jgi:hypothetical protein
MEPAFMKPPDEVKRELVQQLLSRAEDPANVEQHKGKIIGVWYEQCG